MKAIFSSIRNLIEPEKLKLSFRAITTGIIHWRKTHCAFYTIYLVKASACITTWNFLGSWLKQQTKNFDWCELQWRLCRSGVCKTKTLFYTFHTIDVMKDIERILLPITGPFWNMDFPIRIEKYRKRNKCKFQLGRKSNFSMLNV